MNEIGPVIQTGFAKLDFRQKTWKSDIRDKFWNVL